MKFVFSIGLLCLSVATLPAQGVFLQDSILHDGRWRTYTLYLPQSYSSASIYPLVMALHGGGPGNGEQVIERDHFDEVADTAQYLAVFPDGVFNDWADGRGVTDSELAGVDDVGFLSTLVDHLSQTYPIDTCAVYVAGTSNGGMMAQRLACEATHRFAAYASIISSMPDSVFVRCQPATSAPVLLMNGTDDTWVPYDGGMLGPLTDGGSVIGTDATIQFWKSHNLCPAHSPDTLFLPDADPNDGSTALRLSWASCNEGAAVVLYRMEGAGHTNPGMEALLNPIPLLGYINRDIDAATEIWNFFRQHRKNCSPTSTPQTTQPSHPFSFPNPTPGPLWVHWEGEKLLRVQVFNLQGKLLLQQSPPAFPLDLSGLPAGTYVVRLLSPSGISAWTKVLLQP